MEESRKSWPRAVYLLVLAGVVAIVAAASSFAAGSPRPSTDPASSSAPAQFQQVQEGESQQPDRGSDREPCPEEGRDGGSSSPESRSQPADPTATPEV